MTSYIESAHDNYYMTTGSGYFYKGFLNDIESVTINKGVYSHQGVNVSEIAFIKKR